MFADSDGAFNGLLRDWLEETSSGPRLESGGSIDGVKRGVQGSELIGVLPEYAVAEELTAGTLVELKVSRPLPALALLLTTLATPVEGAPLHKFTKHISEILETV